MQIDRIEETRLSQADETGISALLNRAFDTDFGPFSYFEQRHHVRLVMREAGTIIGHMALGYRAIRLGDVFLDAATLADVATDPAHQGRGVATALMRAMIEEGRAMRADLIMLFGDRPMYAGHGFFHVSNPLTALDLTGRRITEIKRWVPTHLMILPLTELTWDDTSPLDLLGTKF